MACGRMYRARAGFPEWMVWLTLAHSDGVDVPGLITRDVSSGSGTSSSDDVGDVDAGAWSMIPAIVKPSRLCIHGPIGEDGSPGAKGA